MNSTILSDLCLVCSNFNCQLESLHKKNTLLDIQNLLVKNLLLSVFLQNSSFSHVTNPSKMSLKDTGTWSRWQNQNQKQNFFIQSEFPLTQMHHCVCRIERSFQRAKYSRRKEIQDLRSIILASLNTFQFMKTIKTNSLFYHDILQIIKLIAANKFTNQNETFSVYRLPFTQNRIQRTIKHLKVGISIKQKESKKLQKNNLLQTSLSKSVFQDLTNHSHRKIILRNQEKQKSQILQRNFLSTQSSIMCQIMSQQKFFDQITQNLDQILNQSLINIQQNSIKFIERVFEKILIIEKVYLKKLQGSFSSRKFTLESFQFDETQKNACNLISLNPQKSFYPIRIKHEPQKKQIYGEIPQSIEFAYIESIPFPSNRRSIDFSMLQLTDQLLFSYMSALQKLKDLQEICIRKNKLTILSYQLLKNTFPKLRSLDLRQNRINEQIAEVILSFKHLNILYISQCQINPVSLIKICINLQGLNVLYCDRLVFVDSEAQNMPSDVAHWSSDLRGIFYIVCLNLKKLMYFSLKGYFSEEAYKYGAHYNSSADKKLEDLEKQQLKEINIFTKIYQTMTKRHGILEI